MVILDLMVADKIFVEFACHCPIPVTGRQNVFVLIPIYLVNDFGLKLA